MRDKLIQFFIDKNFSRTWSILTTAEILSLLGENGLGVSGAVDEHVDIARVGCFKACGEDLIKELGYELNHQYDHDEFHTNRYRKGLLIVEFTYEAEELLTMELTIDETYCKPITIHARRVLAQKILNRT